MEERGLMMVLHSSVIGLVLYAYNAIWITTTS